MRVADEVDDLEALARLEASGERIDVSDGECMTAWRRWGQGPAAVLIHGGSGSWTHWVRNIEALSAMHTVLVPDLPGYGDSADLPAGLDVRGMAGIVAQALDTLLPTGDTVDLVAFSFGCIVAGHVAALRPWRVGRLVLIGSVGLGIRRVGQRPMRSWRHESDPAALRELHRENLASLMFHDESRIDDLAVELQSRNAAHTRFRSKQVSHSDELLRTLGDVEAPLFGIWGSADATASGRVQELGPMLQAVSPTAQFVTIQGSGHWVQYERAAEFNTALGLVLADE